MAERALTFVMAEEITSLKKEVETLKRIIRTYSNEKEAYSGMFKQYAEENEELRKKIAEFEKSK